MRPNPPCSRPGRRRATSRPGSGCRSTAACATTRPPHVHDELHARCLVLDDGKTRLAIVVCDSCMIPREVVAEAKRRIRERAGLEPGARPDLGHAHPLGAGGDGRLPERPGRRVPAVPRRPDRRRRRAARSTTSAPARIGWGVGKNAEQVFNRRWQMKPGTIPPDPFGRTTDQVKMNPPPGSPDLVEPAGPIDPEVSVARGPDARRAGRSRCWPTTRCTTSAASARRPRLGRLLRRCSPTASRSCSRPTGSTRRSWR